MIMGTHQASQKDGASEHDGQLLDKVVRYIQDHTDESLKVCQLARTFGVSRRWLSILFATRLGRTPHDEIVRARFARVEHLLVETDLTLAEIAARCGFRHSEYMSVAFSRRHGVPPSQWRRDHRQLQRVVRSVP